MSAAVAVLDLCALTGSFIVPSSHSNGEPYAYAEHTLTLPACSATVLKVKH